MQKLFIIHDNGDTWKITGATEIDEGFDVNPLMYYKTTSDVFYDEIKDLLTQGNDITYPKNTTPQSVADVNILQLDNLTIKKSEARTKGKYILKAFFDYTIQFDFFRFQVLNNQLCDMGHFITEENREEKYLEIVNEGSDVKINLLEQYLELLDTLSIHLHHYNNYDTFVKEVNNATDAAGVDVAFDTYTKKYG